jgi:undecaprenyl phosphate N,N'-diacetylbacillosamine 1-phosphate transferase
MYRILDIIIALILIIIFMPIWIVIAIIYLIKEENIIIYSPKRMGLNDSVFKQYKFRTMHVGSIEIQDSTGNIITLKNDSRITPIGKYLRASGLDESLQLINILMGQMSFVGPRPIPTDCLHVVKTKYYNRNSVRPGLISLSIIFAENDSWPRKQMCDYKYVKKNKTLCLYFFILSSAVKIIYKRILKL